MRKILLFLALNLFLGFTGLACTCAETNEQIIKELKNVSDFIFVGTVLNGDNWNPHSVEQMNQSRRASNVYIRVDSVISGNLMPGEIIFIFQTASGCTETFEYAEQQLIFANQYAKIEKLKKAPSKYEGELPPTDIPPPPPKELQADGTYETYADDEIVDFLKNQLEKQKMLDTDMCRSFLIGSETASDVIRLLGE